MSMPTSTGDTPVVPALGSADFQEFIREQSRSAWDRALSMWLVRIPIAAFALLYGILAILVVLKDSPDGPLTRIFNAACTLGFALYFGSIAVLGRSRPIKRPRHGWNMRRIRWTCAFVACALAALLFIAVVYRLDHPPFDRHAEQESGRLLREVNSHSYGDPWAAFCVPMWITVELTWFALTGHASPVVAYLKRKWQTAARSTDVHSAASRRPG